MDQTCGGRSLRSAGIAGAHAMIGLLDRVARPLLYALDPEDAHRLATKLLQIAPLPPAGSGGRRLAARGFRVEFSQPRSIAPSSRHTAPLPPPPPPPPLRLS